MQERYLRQLVLLTLAMGAFIVALAGVDLWLLSRLNSRGPTQSVQSKIGSIASKDGLYFEVPKTSPVAMSIGDTVRYQLDDPFAAEEFTRLLPHGGHVVYISDGTELDDESEEGHMVWTEPQVFTVALFHQLKCLDIIRRELTDFSLQQPTRLAAHCMNYLRQMILCRANTGLESVKHPLGAVERTYDAVCKDWEAVYKETERNQRAYASWKNSTARGAPQLLL